MVIELVIPTQDVPEDTWENPIDLFQSSQRKIIKDTLRRFKLVSKSPFSVELTLQAKTVIDESIHVKENLWRVKKGYSEWSTLFTGTLYFGNNILDTGHHRYRYSLIEIENGFNIGISYEFRNVFAEQAGQLISRAPFKAPGGS